MRRALVTGATGFIGRQALAPLKARGYELHAVARKLPADRPTDIAWHEADLLDRDARTALLRAVKPSHLLHLAWIAEHGVYWESPLNAAWIEASQDLVAQFQAAGGSRIVAAGTCAEYDWTALQLKEGDCVERTTPRRPATLYGQSKLRFADWLAQRPGLSSAWGRLFFLHGPAEDARRLVPSVILAVLAGRAAAIGPGMQIRDFLATQDAGAAFAALLDSEVTGPVNIASGIGTAIADVALRIGDLLGRRELVQIGALPPRPGEPPRLVADTTRLSREVGFRPAHDLESGLAATIGWWRMAQSSGLRQAG
jgi:nucleoside-diphosphate-sugar epimerase